MCLEQCLVGLLDPQPHSQVTYREPWPFCLVMLSLASWPPGQGSTAPCEDPLSFVPTFAFQTYLAAGLSVGVKWTHWLSPLQKACLMGERGGQSPRRSLSGDG